MLWWVLYSANGRNNNQKSSLSSQKNPPDFARSDIPPLSSTLSCWWAVLRTIPLSMLWDVIIWGRRREVLRQQLWLTHTICEALGQLSGILHRGQTQHGSGFTEIPLSKKSSLSPNLLTPTMLSEWGRAVTGIYISFFQPATDMRESMDLVLSHAVL